MRHVIISAFVNLTAGTTLYRPGSDKPHALAMRERVTPPGSFESHDEEQIARLIRARCLKASDTAIKAPPAPVDPKTDNSVSPPASGDAVSHTFQNDPAPDTSAQGGPIAGAGAGIAVGGADGVSPPAGTGASPPETGDGVSPPAASATPPPPPPAPRKSGGRASAVAGADGGGSGDGAVSNRERRRLAREAAKKSG